MKVVGAAALAALVLAGASASAAERAFPGGNGSIVFLSGRTSPDQPEIYAVPIAGGRRVNLTRNSGWDSAPLPSPDGTLLLFRSDRQGEAGLWVMAAAGGVPRLIGSGWNAAWSPDGGRVAFNDDEGRILVLDVESGAKRTLAHGRHPAWSPDGRSIAFLTLGLDGELHVVGADGSGERQLAAGLVLSTAIAHAPAWSRDGTRIALAGAEVDAQGRTRAPQIRVVRIDGRGVEQLTDAPGAKGMPAWSPNGRRLVYVVGWPGYAELAVVDAQGGEPRRLTRTERGTYDAAPAWSPNGAWVAFARGPGPDGTDAMLVRADGTGLRRLTPAPIGLPLDGGPVWARDGRSVLYAAASADRDPDLFSVRPDGSGLRRVTNDRAVQSEPSSSPDGAQIAFVQLHLSGRPNLPTHNEEIHVVRADGTGLRRLTRRAGEDSSPSWSPDGSRIVFVRRVRRLGLLAIYTMRADGRGVRRLTPREAFYWSPVWSPDGRRIAYTEGNGVGGGGRLYVMNADGTSVRALGDDERTWFYPRWSPDGRSLAAGGVTSCGGGCDTAALYVVRADGSGERMISDEGGQGIAWSPEGAEIAIGLRGSIAAITVEGGGVRQVTGAAAPGAEDSMPDWAPRCSQSGTAQGDRLVGTGGADLLCGRAGADLIRGGAGGDRLFGGEGDDRIEARDGGFDVIGCGPGFDVVAADRRDLVGEDCEQ